MGSDESSEFRSVAEELLQRPAHDMHRRRPFRSPRPAVRLLHQPSRYRNIRDCARELSPPYASNDNYRRGDSSSATRPLLNARKAGLRVVRTIHRCLAKHRDATRWRTSPESTSPSPGSRTSLASEHNRRSLRRARSLLRVATRRLPVATSTSANARAE